MLHKFLSRLAAAAMFCLLLATVHAKADWQKTECAKVPVGIGDTLPGAVCQVSPPITSTRAGCVTRNYQLNGRTGTDTYYLFLQRLETGQCYFYEFSEAITRDLLKQATGSKASDWGTVSRLDESFVVDFRIGAQRCFGFSERGGKASYLGFGWTAFGNFCTKNADGYDDARKRWLINTVIVAP